jgi:hypothetical protein
VVWWRQCWAAGRALEKLKVPWVRADIVSWFQRKADLEPAVEKNAGKDASSALIEIHSEGD